MALSFTPEKEKLDELLKEVELEYRGWENADKEDLNDQLAPLLELAAMWKAQNYRHIANGAVSILRQLLERGGQMPKDMDNVAGETGEDKWSQFLEEVEQGFIGQSGITDNLHPYGKDFERRPRVRKIGEDAPNQQP
jgi:hemerythrin-like domain-containing protein